MTPAEAQKKYATAARAKHVCYETYQAAGVATEATPAYSELRKAAADVEKQAARLVDLAEQKMLLALDDLQTMGLTPDPDVEA